VVLPLERRETLHVQPNTDGQRTVGEKGFAFCTTRVISIVVFYFEFPETKDRTFAELDEMFEQKVPTREFRKYKTHGFARVGR
jgi:MFS transporter, SP family, general alpha glucoside:H+ symporter